MLYTSIPYVDKKISRIIFGSTNGMNRGENTNALLDTVFEAGVTVFDTARVYGKSEETLGRWIRERGCREEIVILSKGAHPGLLGNKRVTPAAIKKDLSRSLSALDCSSIDIYLLHRDDPTVPVGPIVETLNELHAAGKIHAFGGSNWTHQRIEEANEYARRKNLIPFSVSSPNFGLAFQAGDPWGGGCITLSGPSGEEARNWYRSNQMPIAAYSSLGRGFFSGRLKSHAPSEASMYLDRAAIKGYVCPENFERLRRCELLAAEKNCTVPALAMSWIFRQGLNVSAIVSSTKAERIRTNIDALHLPLTPEESEYLDLRRDTL